MKGRRQLFVYPDATNRILFLSGIDVIICGWLDRYLAKPFLNRDANLRIEIYSWFFQMRQYPESQALK